MQKNAEDQIQQYIRPPAWFWVLCLLGMAWYIQEAYEFYQFYIKNFTSIAELPINIWFISITATAILGGLLGFILLMLNNSLAVVMFKTCLLFTLIIIVIGALFSEEAPNIGYLPDNTHSLFLFFIAYLSGFFANSCHKKGWITL